MLTRRTICALGAGVVLAACTNQARPISFPLIEHATRVRVLIADQGEREPGMSSSGLVGEFDDPVAVARLLQFVNARRDGFVHPPFGPPIPEVTIEILNGDELQSAFRSGPNFFQRATFWTRNASPSEVLEFLSLIGVDPARLRHPPRA